MPKLELIFSSSSFKVISFSFSPATTFKGALSINLSFDNFFSMTISNSLIFVFLFRSKDLYLSKSTRPPKGT